MVDREVNLSYEELLGRPLTEDYVTLTCVSNPVALHGNARWLGASLASLLREARVQSGADQLLCTSADGFTSGTPIAAVLDGRDALLAVAMNGERLPIAHGFPVRMVVPGLYGYVSATEWLTDIKVTTFAAETAYWSGPPGRSKRQSRPSRRRRAERLGRHHGRQRWPAWPGHNTRESTLSRSAWTAALAPGAPRTRARHRHLAAVDVGLGGGSRPAPDRGPRHRRHRLHPDGAAVRPTAKWGDWLPRRHCGGPSGLKG